VSLRDKRRTLEKNGEKAEDLTGSGGHGGFNCRFGKLATEVQGGTPDCSKRSKDDLHLPNEGKYNAVGERI